MARPSGGVRMGLGVARRRCKVEAGLAVGGGGSRWSSGAGNLDGPSRAAHHRRTGEDGATAVLGAAAGGRRRLLMPGAASRWAPGDASWSPCTGPPWSGRRREPPRVGPPLASLLQPPPTEPAPLPAAADIAHAAPSRRWHRQRSAPDRPLLTAGTSRSEETMRFQKHIIHLRIACKESK
jgi:hypothetical protein